MQRTDFLWSPEAVDIGCVMDHDALHQAKGQVHMGPTTHALAKLWVYVVLGEPSVPNIFSWFIALICSMSILLNFQEAGADVNEDKIKKSVRISIIYEIRDNLYMYILEDSALGFQQGYEGLQNKGHSIVLKHIGFDQKDSKCFESIQCNTKA